MSTIYDKYETVIGLEVHAQLMTKSKAYSSDRNEYGSTPNTNVSVVTLGHPGTLPKYNKQGINFAVKMGLANPIFTAKLIPCLLYLGKVPGCPSVTTLTLVLGVEPYSFLSLE